MSQLPTNAQNVPTASLTSHAILVPWGLFAQRIGLVKKLEKCPSRSGNGPIRRRPN